MITSFNNTKRLLGRYHFSLLKGEDLVDVLKRNLSDPMTTRRQIIMRLIYLGKVASAKDIKMMT